MAISTQNDIVLDVMRAVDPAAAETARARLASFATRAGEMKFEATAPVPDKTASEPSPTAETFAKFEAVVLQTFLQSMMPSDTESVYGEGMAGDMWQSMMAEQLANVMAERGGIGIADRILRDHYVADGKKVAINGVSSDPAKADRDTQEMLSVALVQEMQRKLAQSLSEENSSARAAPATL